MDNRNYKTERIRNINSKFDFFIKVEVVGDSKVGKTALLKQLINNEFDEEYIPTYGYEFNIYIIKINEIIIKFQIWDMSGADNYRISLLHLYRNATLGILVYSVCSRESFNNLENWIIQLKDKAPTSKINLLGNKCDEKEKREVSYEEGKEICEKYNLEYFMEISAKYNFNKLNFMEIGAISIYKEYIMNGSDISNRNLNESIMLNNPVKSNRNKCCK